MNITVEKMRKTESDIAQQSITSIRKAREKLDEKMQMDGKIEMVVEFRW